MRCEANPSYLDFSRYACQLDQYLDVFPREQVLVLVSEDLRSDRANAMARVYRFLGLGEESPPEVVEQEFHRTTEKTGASTELRGDPSTPGLHDGEPVRAREGEAGDPPVAHDVVIDPSEAEISEVSAGNSKPN